MLQFKSVILTILLVLVLGLTAHATPYYVETSNLGYTGTVSYYDSAGTLLGSSNTTQPRNAYVLIKHDPGNDSYFAFTPDWEYHIPSNQDDSFFQIDDINGSSVISSSGSWNSALTEFSVHVTGQNSTSAADLSAAWMPDLSTLGYGTWLDYDLSLTASGMTAIIDNGWFWNGTWPASIAGTFTGKFKSDDSNVDTIYEVALTLSSTLFDNILANYHIPIYDNEDPPNIIGYEPVTDINDVIVNEFGTPIPEPSTIFLLGVGLVGLTGIARKKRI
ncbi:MAG: PEP-CTERM sorting domain-containing protein [Desulfobacterium sp.]|nr:PEP-CTERM sorting domain-containing protein [Desulfobacterium sp.]